MEHEAEMNMKLEETVHTVRKRTKAAHPDGTKLQYAPKVKEFSNRCNRKGLSSSSAS